MKLKSNNETLYCFVFTLIFVCFSYGQNASITINANEKISEILTLKKKLETENKLSDGYTIQLYYGELKVASRIIRDYQKYYDSWPASIEYETPNYKVWVGNFNTRLEADRARIEIKNKYPSAFILKPDRN
mgnify:CR=1 FL=1|jgi:hypothetical protein